MPNVAFIRKEVKDKLKKWELISDVIEGEDKIKSKGDTYLPKPQTDGDPKEVEARFAAYILRAVFYWVTGRTLEGLLGQVFSKPLSIELPSELEFFENNLDGAGNGIEQQTKKALHFVLSKGRGGLLADFPTMEPGKATTRADIESGKIRPRVLHYTPERIINWREANLGGETYLTLLVLTESKETSDDGFEVEYSPRWRVFQCDGQTVQVTVYKESESNVSSKNVEQFLIEEGPYVLRDYKSNPISRIPFSFLGSRNNDSEVDEPPLYPLASLNIAHYRNSADLEESSFIAGQPTLLLSGLTQDWLDRNLKSGVKLGSRSAIPLPEGGSGTLLQADPNQLPHELMKHKEEQMKALGAKLIEQKKVPETATGAAIEETSEASVLSSSANNISTGYKKAIWFASQFVGEFKEDDITVELNTDFQVSGLNAQELAQIIASWQAEVITWTEAREAYRKNSLAYLTDEEAEKELEKEAAKRGDFKEDPQIPGQQDPNQE